MTPTGGRSRTASESNVGARAASALSLAEQGTEVNMLDDGDGNRLPNITTDGKLYGAGSAEPIESYLAITIQVFIPFLVAGLGMVGAGLVLDLVQVRFRSFPALYDSGVIDNVDLLLFQHWEVFEKVNELMILVPALLGLKGNLEMTLASRLSTQANLGHMDTPKQQSSMIVGNLVLIQVIRRVNRIRSMLGSLASDKKNRESK